MKPAPLLTAFAKTERVMSQINELNNRIRTFFQTNPYQVTANLNDDNTKQVWRFVLTRKLPHDLAIIAGEILHNLRSPLDQVACAVALFQGRSETGGCFAFAKTLDEFELELRKQKKLPPDAHELIRSAKPYRGGNDVLYALHHLNRNDKHRVGLVPINMPAETSASYICFWAGLPLVIGCKTGKHYLMEKAFTRKDLIETGKPLALYDARPNRVVFGDAGTPGDESLEFMTTTPGAKFEADFYPSLNIGFGDVGLDGMPIIIALNEFHKIVHNLLLSFERKFFN